MRIKNKHKAAQKIQLHETSWSKGMQKNCVIPSEKERNRKEYIGRRDLRISHSYVRGYTYENGKKRKGNIQVKKEKEKINNNYILSDGTREGVIETAGPRVEGPVVSN